MNKEKMSLALLDEVEVELKRFQDKLCAARMRFISEEDKRFPAINTKETAAVRRAALDLKNELTRITQSRSY